MSEIPDFLLNDKPLDFSSMAPEEKLASARDMAQRLVRIDGRIAEAEEELKKLQAERLLIMHKQLPDLMNSIGIDNIGLPQVNADIKLKPYYKASIAADWEPARREAAFGWLEREGHGDILSIELSVSMPRGYIEEARRLEQLLRSNTNHPISFAQSVPWNTLTKFVRERTEAGDEIPLDTLGATVGQVAKIERRKS